MANNKEQKLNKFQIKGIAVYPKTHAPYRYDKATKKSVLDREEGKFQIEVAVSAAQAEPLIARIKQLAKEEGLKESKVKNWPYREETDRDTDEPTGRILFKAKGYALKKDGSPNRILHVDKKAKPLPSDFRLTGGSEVIIDLWAKPFAELGGGVSLNLNGVQVLKYVEYENNPFTSQADDDDDDDEDNETSFKNEDDGEEDEDENKSTDF